MRLAVSICSSAMPVLPMGKKTSGSESRHAERARHVFASQSWVLIQVRATRPPCSRSSAYVPRGVLVRTFTSRSSGPARPSRQREDTGDDHQGARGLTCGSAYDHRSMRSARVLAHRGACRVARENTVEAFAAARALGADGVE